MSSNSAGLLPDASSVESKELKVGGDALKLDELGPVVVNQVSSFISPTQTDSSSRKDGTLSRIANWKEMSEIERKNTLRVLGKRNQARMAELKQQSSSEETKSNSEST